MQEIDQILDDCCTNMSNMVLQIDYTSLTNPTLRRSEELQGYKFPHYAAESLVARAPRLDPDGEFLKVFLQMYGKICEQRSIILMYLFCQASAYSRLSYPLKPASESPLERR